MKILVLSDVHSGARTSIGVTQWGTYGAIAAFQSLHQELISMLQKEDYDIIVLLGDMIEGSKLAKSGKSFDVWTVNTTEQSKAVRAFLEEAKILPLKKGKKLYNLMGTATHDDPQEMDALGSILGSEKDGQSYYFSELNLGIGKVWCNFIHNCSVSATTLDQELKSGILLALKNGYKKTLIGRAHTHSFKALGDSLGNQAVVNFGLTFPSDFAVQKGLRNRTETIGYCMIEITDDEIKVIPKRIIIPTTKTIKIN